jgi:hypothetical protein
MGVELTPELLEVAAKTRVLRDRVLVKLIEYVHPLLVTPGIQIQKGVVIAVGPGRRERRKVEFRQEISDRSHEIRLPNGKTAKFGGKPLSRKKLFFEDGPETGRVLPLQVKQGDVIEFGFRNVEIVDFDRIAEFYNLNLGSLVFIWHESVYTIDPEEDLGKIASQALLFQQSAGHDRSGNWMSGAEAWHGK